jgi:hypothetical protein
LRLSEASLFRQYLERASFRHVRIEAVTREWRLPSAAWLADNFPGISPGLTFIFDALGPEKTRHVQECQLSSSRMTSRMAMHACRTRA